MGSCIYQGFILVFIFFTVFPSVAQNLRYDFLSNQDKPYVYNGDHFTEDGIQLRLFGLLGEDSEEFFTVLNTFLLDINYKGQNISSSYLIWAIIVENWSVVGPLINYGIDVNLTDKWGATALMYAAYCGHVNSVYMLLRAGADPNGHSQNGTVLDAVHRGQENQSCRTKGDYIMTESILAKALHEKWLKKRAEKNSNYSVITWPGK